MTAPAVLRSLFFLGLAGIVLLALRTPTEAARGELRLTSATPARLAAALLDPSPPERIRWVGEQAPDGRALWLLSPGEVTPPLALPVGQVSRLSALAPPRPVAGRHASLQVATRFSPGDSAWAFWTDALGAVDSVLLHADDAGDMRAGLRVSPSRAGWQSWWVRMGTDSTEVGAWVREAGPLEVLIAGGTPDWESRFAARALEASGINVDARFDLGRRSVGGELSDDLARYDVVLLMGELSLTTAAQDRLRTFVDDGGGLVVAPTLASVQATRPSALRALLRAWGMGDSLQVGRLRQGERPSWSLPPELSPLPEAPATVRALGLASIGAEPSDRSLFVAARGPDDAALVILAQVGRGRVGFTGLSESWRWRMEAGDTEAHEAWWRDWVHWAASGLRDPFAVTVPGAVVPTGSRVDVTFELVEEAGALPTTVDLERPAGGREVLPLEASGVGAPAGHVSFLAPESGAYRVSWPGGETGIRADSAGSVPQASDRSLAALASGKPGMEGIPLTEAGRPASASSLAAWTGSPRPWPRWMGATLALLLLAEWTLRRTRGGP